MMKNLLFELILLLILQPFSLAAPSSGRSVISESRDELTHVNSTGCRCFPGDDCWPTFEEWNDLNKTLSGRLIATIPIASVCHEDSFASYDPEACAQLQSVWQQPETHYETSSSPMAPIFANMSCDPFTAPTAQCVVGAYVQYSVNASSVEDYQTTLAFVRTHNIRLVVRNTGHDYFGKSTGAGAIALWTHHLKDVSFLDYSSSAYQGKAMKIGAGVQNIEAQTAAHAQGLVVVGGDCQSVGLAGGYTQGGGHGPLASKLGLGADQVLEWELVTTTGEHLTASPTENPDLYWALSGGGGGTYGLVFSLTVRAYPDFQTAMANLTFSKNVSDPDPFYQAVEKFVTTLPAITDAGATAIWLLTSTVFSLSPMTGPGMTSEQLQALLQPTLDRLDTLGIAYDHASTDSPTYLDSYHLHPQYTITEANIGGRLIPRSIVDSSNSTAGLISAMKFITSNNGAENGLFSGVSVNVTSLPSTANSVNPVWRSVLFNAVIGLPYDTLDFATNVAAQDTVTTQFVPKLAELTPNGGSYINEGDYNQPDFQKVFYGTNYQRLLDIKHKYDPEDILYARTAVGSDAWTTEPDGRLCRV